MAFDAPRKTLDDIRRELDAEFGETAATHTASDSDASEHPVATDAAAVASVRRPSTDVLEARTRDVAPSWDDDFETARHDAAVVRRARLEMRPRRRGGYIAAGVIGCLVGQLVLIGFMVVMRHRPVSAPSLEPSTERVAATPLASTATAPTETPQTPTSQTATEPESSAARVTAAPPTELPPPTTVAPATTAAPAPAVTETPPAPSASSTPPPSISIPPATPPASIATPAPPATDPRAVPRRVVKRAPTPAPAPPPAPAPVIVVPAPSPAPVRSAAPGSVGDSPNWATSQEEVRAALSHWLATTGRADQSIVSDTVVFLGADGRTARTHVPMRWGSKVVIREQRWVRGPNGWALIDDREAWQGR